MKSLTGRLTLSVVGVVAVSLTAFSLLVYSGIHRAMLSQFDARLAGDAQALANMVEERGKGPWELELSAFAEFESARAGGYYQLWMDDGAVLAKSPSLGASQLSLTGDVETQLPDGRPGRAVRVSLLPRHDEESPRNTGRQVRVAVARATEPIDETTAMLRLMLWAGGLTTLALAGLASRWAVGRGLQPVLQLSQRIDAIDDKRLTERFPVADLPVELAPVVGRLNALLERLEQSFSRERQFSGDASHELRTPIAGLRSILEVTLRRERSGAEYQTALTEALAVTQQLAGLVETLLLLTRLEGAPGRAAVQPVALRSLVDEALAPLNALAQRRRLSIRNEVSADTVLSTDPVRFRVVIANLLGNAVEYADEGGQVVVRSEPTKQVWLEVRNTGPRISPEVLPRIFERFFRADPSRTGSEQHHGLGLSVVRGVCDALGAAVSVENCPNGWIAFAVTAK